MPDSPDPRIDPGKDPTRWWQRIVGIAPALLPLGATAIAAAGWPEALSLEALVRHRAAIEALVAGNWLAAVAAYTAIYAVAAGCSLPGVVLLTIAGGAVFGGLAGGLAAVTGATAGATGVFLLARRLVAARVLGSLVTRRVGAQAERLAAGFREDGFNYLLFMRLVPIFPFLVVNLVPALCGVRLATFVAATVLGIIPATFAFAFFGAGLDRAVAGQAPAYRACVAAGGTDCRFDLDPSAAATPQLIAALVVLGVLALIPVAVRRYKSARASAQPPDRTSSHT